MSANNGVYILHTKEGQYRVTHIVNGIEILYDNWNKLNLDVIVREFKYCRYTYNKDTAMYIANKIQDKVFSEYGIKELDLTGLTWQHAYERGSKKINI